MKVKHVSTGKVEEVKEELNGGYVFHGDERVHTKDVWEGVPEGDKPSKRRYTRKDSDGGVQPGGDAGSEAPDNSGGEVEDESGPAGSGGASVNLFEVGS